MLHLLHNLNFWSFYMGLLLAVFLLDLLVFALAAKRARRLAAQGQTARAVRLLKWIVRLPSYRGEGAKIDVRYVLGVHLGKERQFADAVMQWQKILRFLYSYGWRNLHGLEADVRIHLADCLEMLGQRDEAEPQRARAQESLDGKKPTMLSLSAQSDLLKIQGKHTGAYNALEQGLRLINPRDRAWRVDFMTRLMLAAYSNGRPDLTVQWAEQTSEYKARYKAAGTVAIGCLRMAGYGYGEMGDWENAERCRQEAQAMAEREHDVNEQQAVRVLSAFLLHKRGLLSESINVCRELLASEPPAILWARAWAYTLLAECLCDMGRFDEALNAMYEVPSTHSPKLPSAVRRAWAVFSLHMAMIVSAAERPAEALAFLREAASELGRDERLGLWVSAVGACIHAQSGQREQAEIQTEAVLRALPRFAQDHAALLLAYSSLARAAYSLGDWARSQELWTLYFAQEPYPNGLPMGWYYQGECALALGNEAGARAKFQEAQTVNPEFYHARLARRRLDEITT